MTFSYNLIRRKIYGPIKIVGSMENWECEER